MQELTQDVEQTAVLVDAGAMPVVGELTLPAKARGIVVLVHGLRSRSTRPRDRALAEALARDGLGALACELFGADEEVVDRFTRHLRHDARVLAGRVASVVAWLGRQRRFARMPIGLLGADTGAAAALLAATDRREVGAVVALGGRTELTRDRLAGVRCPTLFVAGSADGDVIASNCRAMRQMSPTTAIRIVLRAHQLEAPTALRDVVAVACAWFSTHLGAQRACPRLTVGAHLAVTEAERGRREPARTLW